MTNKNIYDYKATDTSGNEISLTNYKNKVLLIVNVASQCGFTEQYKDLEKIYKELKGKDFEILAFPCNQFGSQEPGNDEEIKKFCQLNYDVTFPIFKKIDVNGENAHPIYVYLKDTIPGLMGLKSIKWNFTKFLIDKNGMPIARYAPTDKPMAIKEDILKLL